MQEKTFQGRHFNCVKSFYSRTRQITDTWPRSDGGVALETSAFKSFYGVHFINSVNRTQFSIQATDSGFKLFTAINISSLTFNLLCIRFLIRGV